ncbi:hypothetical protein J8L85_17845, partial [Maribacter sp. MMG018]|uniref:beta strand repeat-containing protein n=1 Tax=Maribacter sp. MMG018 TaxID=2822688 RepID=UPI001B38144C
MRSQIITTKSSALKSALAIFTLLLSSFAFAQTTVTLEDQCNCEVLQGTDVSAPGVTTPAGADLGDLYVNTTTGTIYFWDGDSWELTATDLNTTNTSFTIDSVAGDLVITDSDSNEVRVPLADIAAEVDTNTTNVTFEVNTTTGTLDIVDSDAGIVSVPLTDIAAEVNTDDQNATEVNLLNPIDVDGDSTNETTVEEALADLAANNALDLDIDPTNELTTSGSGVPAGAPANNNPGVTYLDTSTNELYVYDGTNWTMVTDNQNATEVNLLNPIDVDGDSANETTVEEALADLAANNALDLDIDPTNELTTSGSGVPAGAPANDNPGVTYLDTSTNELYVYDGTNWNMVTDNQNLSEVLADGNDGGGLAITNIANPSNAQDAATKAYVDGEIAAATTLNDGQIYVGDAGNNAVGVTASGDATISNTGVIDLTADAVETDEIIDGAVTSDKILDGTIATIDIADDAVNAEKINSDVAGSGLVQNASGALDVDVSALTGDGSITSSDIDVTGGVNSTLNDVTLTIADNAITNAKMADDAITTAELANDAVSLEKLAHGTADGQVMRWDAATSSWTLVDLGSVTVTENDGVIGNEVTGATDGTLTLSGLGTTVSPLTLGITAGGVSTVQLA